MDSIAEIDNQLTEARERRRQLILNAMDGRTQKSISIKTGIDEPRLSKWINGFGELDKKEVDKLKEILGIDFQ